MQPKVSFFTIAYNAEKYIDACAQSILNQTMREIEWIVLDNGCTDSTYDILCRYASEDSRIRIYRNEGNSYTPNTKYTYKGIYELFPFAQGEYFAVLDSDDVYDVAFAETMYSAAVHKNADMALCGTDFVDEATGKVVGARVPPKFEGLVRDLCIRLPEFYGCLRPVWQKIYRTETWIQHKNFILMHSSDINNGVDTYIDLRFLSVSDRVASVNKSMHKYLIRKDSAYHSMLKIDRWKAYDILFLEGMSLLTQNSAATDKNLSFLSEVHILSLKDMTGVAQRAEAAPANNRIQFLLNAARSPVLKIGIHYIAEEVVDAYYSELLSVVNTIVQTTVKNKELSREIAEESLNWAEVVCRRKAYLGAVILGQTLSTFLKREEACTRYSVALAGFYLSNKRRDDAAEILRFIQSVFPDNLQTVRRELLINIMKNGNCGAEDFSNSIKVILPEIGAFLTRNSLSEIMENQRLFRLLLQDDYYGLLEGLLEQSRLGTERIGLLINELIPQTSPLKTICDDRFFAKYCEVCALVIRGDMLPALELMTEELLADREIYNRRAFLNLFVTIAAVLEHEGAFLYGKFQLAWLALDENRVEDCQSLLTELAEMGLAENEEWKELNKQLA